MIGRFIILSSKRETVELALTAPSDQFEALLPAISQLLASLRIGPINSPIDVRTHGRE